MESWGWGHVMSFEIGKIMKQIDNPIAAHGGWPIK